MEERFLEGLAYTNKKRGIFATTIFTILTVFLLLPYLNQTPIYIFLISLAVFTLFSTLFIKKYRESLKLSVDFKKETICLGKYDAAPLKDITYGNIIVQHHNTRTFFPPPPTLFIELGFNDKKKNSFGFEKRFGKLTLKDLDQLEEIINLSSIPTSHDINNPKSSSKRKLLEDLEKLRNDEQSNIFVNKKTTK